MVHAANAGIDRASDIGRTLQTMFTMKVAEVMNPPTIGEVVDGAARTLSGASAAYLEDNGVAREALPQMTQNEIGRAIGHTLALAQSGAEIIGGGGEALITAPAAATGAGAVVPAAGAAVATHGVTVAANTVRNIINEPLRSQNNNPMDGNKSHNVEPSAAKPATEAVPSNQAKPVYELNPKHKVTKVGEVSAAPKNGQVALDNSVQVKETSTRRVGVDKANNEFVVFDEHTPGTFHGHTRQWNELRPEMQNALRREGLVDRRGNIIQGDRK